MSQDTRKWALDTSLVHAGERQAAPVATPTSTPIYTSASYIYPSFGALDAAFENNTGYVYTRYGNPTVDALTSAITRAELGAGAVSYSSGMAALHAAILAAGTPRGQTAPQPRSLLISQDLYATSIVLAREFFGARGTQITLCDMTNLEEVDAAIAEAQPDVLLVEQLSNPLLKVVDIAALAQRAKAAGARLIVDNTIATPILQQPLALGADLVVHSATKYLGGHADVAGGLVVARAHLVRDVLIHQSRIVGATLGPFEAQQIHRGIKTLALRVERQCSNAAQIAAWLEEQPQVTRVRYPGLTSHPQHELASQAFNGKYGAMITFDLDLNKRNTLARFFNKLELILPTTSLGDVYTLATAPAVTTHREFSQQELSERGLSIGTIRLSVGIENAADIINDLALGLTGLAE
jgi:cystathionine gamma-synthase